MISMLSDSITALAALAAVVIAYFGLQTWREQLKGKTEYELARRFLRAVYRVRDALALVRNNELPETENENTSQPDLDPNLAVIQMRWLRVVEASSDLNLETIEAEVLWGKEFVYCLKPLRKCVAELSGAIRIYTNMMQRKTSKIREESWKPYERVVYQQGQDPSEDPFGEKILKAVETVETQVRPFLKM
ncbi:MAG: hypothetical protein ACXADB_14780 [Candidatus Hermodarchaeia archaeon]